MILIKNNIKLFYIALIGFSSIIYSCGGAEMPVLENPMEEEQEQEEEQEEEEIIFLPPIDLSHWKVTLPIGDPTEIKPPEILNYPNIEILKEFMFNDEVDSSLVFYTYPGSTTTNSSYSRTELREQMEPGSNSTNWTFDQGGNMRGTLKLDEISKENDGDFHRTMVMQIHGRLTDEQRNEIGEDDNNAPPVLKIYWHDGKVRVSRKILEDENISYPDILHTDAWTSESFWFDQVVNNDRFTLEVDVKGSMMKIVLNDSEEMIFDDIHTEKWGIFENYFKAGNYLQTTDSESFARVKYYDLVVKH